MRSYIVCKSAFLLLLLFSTVTLSSQSPEEAQNIYNLAVEANNQGKLAEAASQFEFCLETCNKIVTKIEDKAVLELISSIQGILPKLYLQIGSNQLSEEKTTEGLATIYKSKDIAIKYGDKQTEETANKLIPQIHYKLAATLLKAEKLDEAIENCDKAIAVNADFTPAYLIKTIILKKKETDTDFKTTALDGIEVCKRTNDTKTQQTITDMAYKYFLTKGLESKGNLKYDDAIDFFNSSLEFRPNDATTLYLQASVYSAMGKYSETISTGQKALENEKGNDEAKAKIYMLIAESYAKSGDIASACDTYKKAAVGTYLESANYQITQVLRCK